MQYRAFVSYSRKDASIARRIHRRLEAQKAISRGDALKNPLRPSFLDRSELAASSDLETSILEALGNSERLIVICSPASARSRWVNAEILEFVRLGRAKEILLYLHKGEPSFDVEDNANAAFPQALSQLDQEPLWVDGRTLGEGAGRAIVRLIAGALGTSFDTLWQRHRRSQQTRAIGFVALAFAVITAVSYGAWQALRPVALTDCPMDRLVFRDAWEGHSFEVIRVGQARFSVCADDREICQRDAVHTVLEGRYRSALPGDGSYSGQLFYRFEELPGAAPCCTWDVAVRLDRLGERVNGPEMRWFDRGKAPPLASMPFASIELVDMYATAAGDHPVLVTRNALTASSCAQRSLF